MPSPARPGRSSDGNSSLVQYRLMTGSTDFSMNSLTRISRARPGSSSTSSTA